MEEFHRSNKHDLSTSEHNSLTGRPVIRDTIISTSIIRTTGFHL